MGESGKPLQVIAHNVREYADKLALVADEAVVSAQLLAEVASSLPGLPGSAGGDVDANTALAVAAGRIRQAADVAEGELAGLTGNIARVIQALDGVTRGMHFRAEIGEILRETGEALTLAAGVPEVEFADVTDVCDELLAELSSLYTMAREREVHAAFVAGPGVLQA